MNHVPEGHSFNYRSAGTIALRESIRYLSGDDETLQTPDQIVQKREQTWMAKEGSIVEVRARNLRFGEK